MFFSVLESKKTVYYFKTLKQLNAAAHWLKQLDSNVTHFTTDRGIRKLKPLYDGYTFYRPEQSPDGLPCDFALRHPDAPYLMKRFLY